MKKSFGRSLAFTLQFEGGYVNHPRDPGGHTNKGITLATLRRYKAGATVGDLKKIPQQLVRQIYRDGYWNKARCDTLGAGVDGAVFDYAVNSGPGAARKSLLRVLGGSNVETVKKLCRKRLSIYRTFRHWKSFGRGWTRRINAGEALWVKWALAADKTITDVKTAMNNEAGKARTTASRQQAGGGAAGAGGAGGGLQTDMADQWMQWAIYGGIAVAVAVGGYLIWRGHMNRQRAKAFEEEALKEEESDQ